MTPRRNDREQLVFCSKPLLLKIGSPQDIPKGSVPGPRATSSRTARTAQIAGGIAGALAFLALVTTFVFVRYKGKGRKAANRSRHAGYLRSVTFRIARPLSDGLEPFIIPPKPALDTPPPEAEAPMRRERRATPSNRRNAPTDLWKAANRFGREIARYIADLRLPSGHPPPSYTTEPR